MAFRFGYFDSEIIGIDDEGMPVFDRAETSDLFALLFANLVSDGVLARPSNCFRIRAAGNGLNLERDPGFGMVKGHFCYDNEVGHLAIETPPQKYSRIDRVIMRCNYLERMVEILIKTGTEAANPVPPELVRPSAGDYFELCLAEITLEPKQAMITQSSIKDTRANSAVCGYITQLIDHLDTSVFFAQLDTFYNEFVAKSNITYEKFCQMAQEAYDNLNSTINNFYTELMEQGRALHNEYKSNISSYIAELKEKGNADLAEITQELLDFRNTNEAAFLEWFEAIKGLLGQFEAGELVTTINTLVFRMEDMEEMIFTGMASARIIIDDEGNYLTMESGTAILAEWKICQCECLKEVF
jgi:hypothetical protein